MEYKTDILSFITPSHLCDVYGICITTRSIGHTTRAHTTAKTGRLSESITPDKLRRTKIPFVVLLKYYNIINKILLLLLLPLKMIIITIKIE